MGCGGGDISGGGDGGDGGGGGEGGEGGCVSHPQRNNLVERAPSKSKCTLPAVAETPMAMWCHCPFTTSDTGV